MRHGITCNWSLDTVVGVVIACSGMSVHGLDHFAGHTGSGVFGMVRCKRAWGFHHLLVRPGNHSTQASITLLPSLLRGCVMCWRKRAQGIASSSGHPDSVLFCVFCLFFRCEKAQGLTLSPWSSLKYIFGVC